MNREEIVRGIGDHFSEAFYDACGYEFLRVFENAMQVAIGDFDFAYCAGAV